MKYEIKGEPFPMVICHLEKGETMKNETGAMAYMTSGMKMETNTGGGLMKGLGRVLSGDTLFLNYFTAEEENQEIGFSSSTPGKIIPITLDGTNTIIGERNAFLAAEDGVDLDIYFKQSLGAGLFAGEGFVLQKFSGKGIVFLEIDGEVIVQELEEGEKILVDPGHIAAMEESVQFDIERVKGAKNIMFGEGLFFTKIEGPGKVWLQTMPITRLAAAIIPYVPKKG